MLLTAATAASATPAARALAIGRNGSIPSNDATCSEVQGLGMDPMFVKTFPEKGELEFILHDDIGSSIYNWPRTLLTYPVDFSLHPCSTEQLRLTDDAGKSVSMQLSAQKKAQDGRIIFAKVSFFSALEPGATHAFKLELGAPPAVQSDLRLHVSWEGNARIVDSGLLKVRMPESQTVATGNEIPGPMLGIDCGEGWIGTSRLLAGVLHLLRIETSIVDTGEIFDIYRMTYIFEGGARYEATLKSTLGYPFIDFSEQMSGFDAGMNVSVEMDWTGFAPERRYAANGWAQPHGSIGIDEPITTPGIIEEPHWWSADYVEDPQKQMVFRLAGFEGNAPHDAVPVMSFWEQGVKGRELGVFVPDTKDWNDYQYMIWQPTTLLQVSFRYNNGHLIWHWPVVSGTRRTGIAFAPTTVGEVVMQKMRDTYAEASNGSQTAFKGNAAYTPGDLHARYAQWLRAWYGSLDLNKVKDWVLTYPSNLRQAPPPIGSGASRGNEESLPQRAARFESTVFQSILMDYPMGSDLGIMNISHRPVRPIVDEYMQVRLGCTAKQKTRIDALLLLSAYINAGEDLAPVRVCLTGTPNMSADGFSVPTEIGVLFPEHPMNAEWRDQFEKTIQLQAQFYTRPAVLAYGSQGGRWTESLPVYNWAYFEPTLTAQIAITHTDGSNRLANKQMAQRALWMTDELSAPIYNPDPYWRQEDTPPPPPNPWKPGVQLTSGNGFERQYTPHGAHGTGTGTVVPDDVPILAQYLARYDPLAAEYLYWAYAQRTSKQPNVPEPEKEWVPAVLAQSKGNAGTNPHLRSSKYTGHGIILRAGVGTPEELSIHLDQTDRGPNYRWGDNGEGSSGVLYFYANGQPWSGHERENTGDHSNDDATGSTTFAVLCDHTWRSIGENILDRPLSDLGLAQFGEISARRDHVPYSWPAYRSRSVMLVGTDYMILGDDVIDGDERAETRFAWFTAKDLPFPKIVFLEPLTARVDHWTQITTHTSKGFLRDTEGPSIVLVTHKKDEVEMERMHSKPLSYPDITSIAQYSWERESGSHAAPGVYYVRTASSHDRVFRNFTPIHYQSQDEEFSGSVGVIRSRGDGSTELALFAGTSIGAKGFHLQLQDDVEVSISARIDADGSISGIYQTEGESHTTITLQLPSNASTKLVTYIDGKRAEQSHAGDTTTMMLGPGRHVWEVTTKAPTPLPPTVVRTQNGRGSAKVFFAPVAGAAEYRLELSTDQAATWNTVRNGTNSPLLVDGLCPGSKVHVRITALTPDDRSVAGPEYPVYLTDTVPDYPDGLALEIAAERVHATWGEVLGVSEYCLYRREIGQNSWTKIYRGLNREFDGRVTGVTPPKYMPGRADNALSPPTGPIYEYAVAAVNEIGEGEKSRAVSTDPAGWLAWWPSGVERKFKRQTGFWLPPYVPAGMTPPMFYPDEKSDSLPQTQGER